ncbi:MAG: hypothetical protein H0U49_12050 [Parachlamydiaceae bacterium]|nr:hypothetical protein [Parachlamydiaceae bacterium]
MTITKKPLPVKASTSPANESNFTPERPKSPTHVEGHHKKPLPPLSVAERKIGPTTRIIIQYDAGFSNLIYVRGKGATLSWEKGIPLKNTKPNEWIWETTTPFTTCEFKVLINDKEYEIGDNHLLTCGASIHYTPKFH